MFSTCLPTLQNEQYQRRKRSRTQGNRLRESDYRDDAYINRERSSDRCLNVRECLKPAPDAPVVDNASERECNQSEHRQFNAALNEYRDHWSDRMSSTESGSCLAACRAFTLAQEATHRSFA